MCYRGGVLELAILGLLKEQDLHGYELKKRLSEMLGFASGVSFGSLYPALARLEAAGAVTAAAPAGASRSVPMTGSLAGELAAFRALRAPVRGRRGKKVYRITPTGESLFGELLGAESSVSEEDRVFALRLAFARYLPPESRLGMLELRRAHLSQRLARARARLSAARDRDSYTQSLVQHDTEAAEHDLSWIDRLIASERATSATATPALTAGASRPEIDSPTISGLHPATPQEEFA